MRRPFVFVSLALFLALVVAMVVYSALKKREAEVQAARLQSVDIIVAARELSIGSKIDENAVLSHDLLEGTFTRAALARFVALPPSPLEKREKLEQLRALEANMSIAVARVDSVPLSVDTPADLARANQILANDVLKS